MFIRPQKSNMQTNVKQRRRNHNESEKDPRCIFCCDHCRAEPLSDALDTVLFNPYYVHSSTDIRLQLLMALERFRSPFKGLDDLRI